MEQKAADHVLLLMLPLIFGKRSLLISNEVLKLYEETNRKKIPSIRVGWKEL